MKVRVTDLAAGDIVVVHGHRQKVYARYPSPTAGWTVIVLDSYNEPRIVRDAAWYTVARHAGRTYAEQAR